VWCHAAHHPIRQSHLINAKPTLAAPTQSEAPEIIMPPALPLKLLSFTASRYSTTTPLFTSSSLRNCLCKHQQTPRISLKPHLGHRFYYGHISDSKMAPQLEPFFKQFVISSSFFIWLSFANSMNSGSMTSRSHSLIVRLFFSQKLVVSAFYLTRTAGKVSEKLLLSPLSLLPTSTVQMSSR
jgi:hypothetical protein